MTMLIEINNGQPIPFMWYIFILICFRTLALENIVKILTTGPRLFITLSNDFASADVYVFVCLFCLLVCFY